MQLEHHIQREIIHKLIFTPRLRFRDLKPEGLESNVLTYHLGQLLRAGLIEKEDMYYSLTSDGMTYADSLSFTNLKPRRQPKLITIIALQSKPTGRYLLAKRMQEPFIGTLMLPNGKLHFGESTQEQAEREQHEKLGTDYALNQRGFVTIRTTQGERVVSHVAAIVYSAEVASEHQPPASERFSYIWVDSHKEGFKLMPGTSELLKLLRTERDLFMADITAPCESDILEKDV